MQTQTEIPLPTILDQYADANLPGANVPIIRVRRAFGTKVWCMTPETFTTFLRAEPVDVIRIDADLNVVVREA